MTDCHLSKYNAMHHSIMNMYKEMYSTSNASLVLCYPCRYFSGYGIIRDIVHSNVLQTIALLAMEPPISLDGEDIRNEKVHVQIMDYKLCNIPYNMP